MRHGTGIGSVLALVGLVACAPGDLALPAQDLATRDATTELVETVTRRMPVNGSPAAFRMSCLDGTVIRSGSAGVSSVTGYGLRRDYDLQAKSVVRNNTVLAEVRHVGAPPRPDEARYVTVELRATCAVPRR